MISLVQIARGWRNLATGENRELALKRLEICDGCPSKRQMNAAGAFLVTMVNGEASTYYCGECGCPLAAKVSEPSSYCDLGNWKATPTSYY